MKKIKQQLHFYWLHREVIIGIVVFVLLLICALALLNHLINLLFGGI